jgi:membrane protein
VRSIAAELRLFPLIGQKTRIAEARLFLRRSGSWTRWSQTTAPGDHFVHIPPLRLRQAFRLGGLTVREAAVRTWNKINDHEILTRASAISFYAMMACVPFLALLLTVVVQFLPDLSGKRTGAGNITVEQLERTLRMMFPREAYAVAEDQISRLQEQLRTRPPVLLLASSLVVTLWLASSLYTAIIDAMNRIYGVVETRSFLKIRLAAIVMSIIQATILLGALVVIVAGPEVLGWMHISGHRAALLTLIQMLAVVVMVLLSFALTFYFGPDAEQHWEWITPGSVVGTFIFLAFTYLFRLYVQHFADYNKTYGSLGGVMVLLFWFWVSTTVLLSAGQFNKVIEDASPLGKAYGQKVDPTEPLDLSRLEAEPAPRRRA